jgi:hypothetical protein
MTADFHYMLMYAEENGFYKWDVVDSPVYEKGRQISYADV